MSAIIYILLNLLLIINCVEKSVTQSVNITLKNGQINGQQKIVDGKSVSFFLGIPYAQPPIGELRFKKPQPLQHHLESYAATQWPNPCIQPSLFSEALINKNLSEDCLYLNIWTPIDVESNENITLKPVMFFIHGGALSLGSSSHYLLNGETLSSLGDVVVVTINYRLNVFGFFYSGTDDAPGNVGLWDQALALQWVNDNIRYFGGDPNKITIFGESAGSWSVSVLLLSPITRNLYKNAIMMSGAVVNSGEMNEPIVSKTKWLSGAKLIGCNNESTPKIIECLRNIDANSLLKIIELKEINEGKFIVIYPVIDGVFVPKSPKQLLESVHFQSNANIMIGTMEDEGSILLPLFVDPIKYNSTSPKNLSYSEAYKELANMLSSDKFSAKINGEEVANVYFREISPNTGDYDLLRRTIGIAFGDYAIGCPTINFARKLFENHRNLSNIYEYHFNIKFEFSSICSEWMGACHGLDLFPVFGLPLRSNTSSHAEIENSLNFIDIFTHFAKHGYPSPQNGKDWPKYYTIDDNIVAPYFDVKNNQFRDGLKYTECEILFKRYYEQ